MSHEGATEHSSFQVRTTVVRSRVWCRSRESRRDSVENRAALIGCLLGFVKLVVWRAHSGEWDRQVPSSCVVGGLEGGRCFVPYAGWQRPAFDGRQAFPWALSGNCRAICPSRSARTWFECKKIGQGVIEICMACNGHLVQPSGKLASTLAPVGPHDVFRRPRSQRSSHHMQSSMSTEESPHSHMPAQAPPHGCGKDHHTLAAGSVKSSLAPPFPAHFQTRGQHATENRAC